MICEAVFPENKGGIERWFLTLSNEFQLRGHEVTHFNAAGVEEVRKGVTYVAASDKKWSYEAGGVRSKTQAIRFAAYLYRWLKNKDFDLIYCSSVPILSVFGAVKAKPDKAKLLVEWFEIWSARYWIRYSGVFLGILGWFVQLLAIQFGSHRLVYTNRASQTLSQYSFDKSRRIVLLPGLCPSTSNYLSTTRRVGKQDIYFLGRFVQEKQPILAILAIEQFMMTGWNGKFRMLGTGPLVHEMSAIVSERNLANTIEIVENPSDIQVDSFASTSFALFHPSRREGYGLAAVEAAYRGIPSILINYPDNATVDLGISPQLVAKKGDVAELVGLLTLAWENQTYFEAEALKWSIDAQENKSVRKTCEEILKVAIA